LAAVAPDQLSIGIEGAKEAGLLPRSIGFDVPRRFFIEEE
jgi:hypothetical protein